MWFEAIDGLADSHGETEDDLLEFHEDVGVSEDHVGRLIRADAVDVLLCVIGGEILFFKEAHLDHLVEAGSNARKASGYNSTYIIFSAIYVMVSSQGRVKALFKRPRFSVTGR